MRLIASQMGTSLPFVAIFRMQRSSTAEMSRYWALRKEISASKTQQIME